MHKPWLRGTFRIYTTQVRGQCFYRGSTEAYLCSPLPFSTAVQMTICGMRAMALVQD